MKICLFRHFFGQPLLHPVLVNHYFTFLYSSNINYIHTYTTTTTRRPNPLFAASVRMYGGGVADEATTYIHHTPPHVRLQEGLIMLSPGGRDS